MTLTDALRRALDRRTPDGRTVAELLVRLIVDKALAGDIRFIRLIFDRIDGPVARQAVEAEPADGRIDIEPPAAVHLTLPPCRPIASKRRQAV